MKSNRSIFLDLALHIFMNQQPLIASRNPSSLKPEQRQSLTLSIFFVTVQFGSLSHIAMSSAAKALAYGMLTFLEIIIVVLVVMSLAAIAVFVSFGPRKRNRPLENAEVLCLTDHHAG